ncbi:MAG: hypothetical protein A3K19_06185 [Lentisphaerae bacterium RIFOXYB12_FULL_65_16]|nr:MAG: hypothetical protein A3K18_08230 [Lentisphaerae bacterium RIFOXYA12_64_32]OGV85669.1 MAG: hypothetical protein A3K19_06185 [Lentisphaerae bacterium RIFOXYB12_FULL_65_16]
MTTRRTPAQGCSLLARRLDALSRDVRRLAPAARATVSRHLERAEQALGDLRQALRATGAQPRGRRSVGSAADKESAVAPYTELMDASLHGVAVLDSRGVIQNVNAAGSALLRLPAHDLKGRRFADFVDRGERDDFRRLLANLCRSVSRQHLQCELTLLSAEGDSFSCAVSAIVRRDRKQKVRRLWCLLCDVTARQQTRAALVDAQTTAQQCLDVAGVMIVALSRTGRITLLNRRGEQILGCKGEEALGQDWFAGFVPPDSRERVRRVFDQLASGELDGSEYFESPVLTHRGVERLIAWHNVVLSDEAGRFAGVLSSGEDITERRMAEAELLKYRDHLEDLVAQRAGELEQANDLLLEEIAARERAAAALKNSEEQYRALVESADEVIATVDYSGTFQFMNSTAAKALGGRPEDLIGKTMWELFPREHADRQVASVRRIMKTGQSESLDSLSQVAGQNRYFHTTMAPLSDSDGNIVGALVIARDVTERRNAAEALRESEARYRALFDNAPVGICIAELDGTFIEVNRHFLELSRLTPDELKTTNTASLYEDPEGRQRLLAELKKSGQVRDWQARMRRRTGEVGTLLFNIDLVDMDGRKVVLSTVQDVTQEKEAERLLRRSEEQYRLLFNAITDAVFVHAVPGDAAPGPIVSVNDATCRLLGYSREELIGHEITEFIAPESLVMGRSPQIIDGLMRARQATFETVMVRKDGDRVPMEVNSAAIEGIGGQIVISLARDITQRKLAEEAIRTSQLLYSTTVDAITDPIHVLDRELRFTLFSKTFANWCRQLGLDPGEPGQCLLDVFPFLPPHVRQEYEDVFATGRTLKTTEVIQVAGREITTETRKIPIFENGKVARVLTIIQDITERRHAERVLQESRQQLRELAARLAEAEEAERRRLAAELHDEIGQSLTAVGINLNLLSGMVPAADRPDVRDRLTGLVNLVEDLAERVRGVTTRLRPPVLDDYGLAAALRWYAEEFRKRHDIPFDLNVTELQPRLPLDVETSLFRIAQEACTNAVKHARADQLSLSLSEDDRVVSLRVTDDGIGFDPDAVSGSMEPSGWGLIIMRERAIAAGGEFELQSGSGQGTSVIVNVRRRGQ